MTWTGISVGDGFPDSCSATPPCCSICALSICFIWRNFCFIISPAILIDISFWFTSPISQLSQLVAAIFSNASWVQETFAVLANMVTMDLVCFLVGEFWYNTDGTSERFASGTLLSSIQSARLRTSYFRARSILGTYLWYIVPSKHFDHRYSF